MAGRPKVSRSEMAVVASEKAKRGLAGGRVDADVLSSIGERIRHLWRLDDLLGGGLCMGLADSDMRLVLSLLKRARYDEPTEHSLYASSAELARFAGWAAFDAGRHVEAHRYWQAGLKAAQRGQDPGIFAYLLSNLAMQATYAGDGRRAVDLLEAARYRAGTSVSFTVRAMLDAWQVRAHAVLGQPREAARLLKRADELWERRVPSDDPAWIYWMTRPSLTAEAGLAFLALGQSQTSERLLVDGLTALSADSQRDRILYLGGIAEARLAQHGGVDGALEAASEAVALASSLGSSRAADQLGEFAARVMSRYPGAPPVKTFHEQLQAAPLRKGEGRRHF
jgi:tetratricopeptide (TPR) repeat protein